MSPSALPCAFPVFQFGFMGLVICCFGFLLHFINESYSLFIESNSVVCVSIPLQPNIKVS